MSTTNTPTKRRGRPYSDPELQRCDELRRITEDKFPAEIHDEAFENLVEATADKCDGEFSPENWKRNL